jgi:hypothetical protein
MAIKSGQCKRLNTSAEIDPEKMQQVLTAPSIDANTIVHYFCTGQLPQKPIPYYLP